MAELQHLSQDECFALLATQEIGRIGINAEHYPLIFPVNYALDHGVIVIRSGAGTKLTHASHANVTFEVDEIDQRHRSGWSVLVSGLAE
jgi:nitroimidazol reductase NimA-like FMN-containing flavoprotein (pyridoxamine 5'-phosphate oxidase superfamily)